ncbi:MAG: hypothetical protein CVU38_02420 [Chloroflexi bacterium HGW-Chloroflexi-1]|nr:MAG: hypothetical protein CVU38_02420 [Chloroflexi bacterium HGW-Chloroflexi-1]
MNEESRSQPLTVLLSREELLAILDVLRAPTIPGLDREPTGELAPDQQAFAVVVARRALLARELAQIRADGELLVHRALLTAVGVCAYSQDAVLAYHWPSGGQAPHRLFGHIRGADVVVHTRPSAVLHRFTLLQSKEDLVNQVLAFCECGDVPVAQPLEFTVPRQDFADARQLASAGDAARATALLTQAGVPNAAAGALVSTLVSSPRVSILQTLKQQGNQAVRSREFTLVQNGKHAWWVAPAAGQEAKAPLLVKTATAEEIRDLLAKSL